MVRCSCIGRGCDRCIEFMDRAREEGVMWCVAAAGELAAVCKEWLVWARVNSN